MTDDLQMIEEALGRHDLPFVASDEGTKHFWSAADDGNPRADFERGCRYAELALKASKDCGGPFLLAVVLRDMVQGGEFTRLEAGFIATIAMAARAGSMN